MASRGLPFCHSKQSRGGSDCKRAKDQHRHTSRTAQSPRTGDIQEESGPVTDEGQTQGPEPWPVRPELARRGGLGAGLGQPLVWTQSHDHGSPSCLPPGRATSISGLSGRMDSKVARRRDTGDSTATYDNVRPGSGGMDWKASGITAQKGLVRQGEAKGDCSLIDAYVFSRGNMEFYVQF